MDEAWKGDYTLTGSWSKHIHCNRDFMKSKYCLELVQIEIKCICSWLNNKSSDINNEHHGWELNNALESLATQPQVLYAEELTLWLKAILSWLQQGCEDSYLDEDTALKRALLSPLEQLGHCLDSDVVVCAHAYVLRLESSPIQDCIWQLRAWPVHGISFPLKQSLFSKAQYSQEFLAKSWVPACNKSEASNNG